MSGNEIRVFNEDIANITEQKTIARTVKQLLFNGNTNIIINSQKGTGKNTLCNKICEEWSISNSKHYVIRLDFEQRINRQVDFSPFIHFINHNYKRRSSVLKNFFIESSKDIPNIGNTISSIVQIITSNINKNKNELSDQGFSIVQILQYLISKRRTLIICENIDKWDVESIELLLVLMNKKIKTNFIDNLSFLLTSNESDLLVLEKIEEIKYEFKLKEIVKNDIPMVLKKFNDSLLITEQQVTSIHSITGGNLQLLKELSKEAHFNLLNSNEEQINIFKLITNRIESEIQENSKFIIDLLKKASFIGENVHELLLEEFSKDEVHNFQQILSHSVDLEFLSRDKLNVKFNDSIVYKVFLNSLQNAERNYHFKLEECIREIYPSSYKRRAFHLLKGGNIDQAAILQIIDLIVYYREQARNSSFSDFAINNFENHSYFKYYKDICDVYHLYFKCEYEQANKLLSEMDENILEFQFEIDYLQALIITNWQYSESDFKTGLIYLEKWVTNLDFKSSHLEMWLRSAILLLDYYYELKQPDVFKQLYAAIGKVFSGKSNTDSYIERRKYMFYMKANVYKKVEIAIHDTEKAYKYFSPLENSNLTIVQYYTSILNHSANLLILGNKSDSFDLMKKAMKLVNDFPNINFFKIEILINNYTLGGYFSGEITITKALELLHKYEMRIEGFADLILINNNLLSLYVISGNYEKAKEIAELLYSYIVDNDDIDDYYRYFTLNNYAMLYYLQGEKEKAKEVFMTIKDLIPLENDKVYFNRRSKLLESFLHSEQAIDFSTEWNDTLILKHPHTVGKAWAFWGKLFLFSELQT